MAPSFIGVATFLNTRRTQMLPYFDFELSGVSE